MSVFTGSDVEFGRIPVESRPGGVWINTLTTTDPQSWNNLEQYHFTKSWTMDPQDEYSETSTVQKEYPQEIERVIEYSFETARDQVFEDGLESEFSRELVFLIKEYGNDAMVVIANLITSEKVNPEVASEALRWLGHMEDPRTYRYRLWVLERSLFCSSVRVRDSAVLGLSFLNDPHAIPYLRRAIEQETFKELRQDMEQVLADLENVQQCPSS